MGPLTISLILQYLILVLNTGEMGDINLKIIKYLRYRIQMLDSSVQSSCTQIVNGLRKSVCDTGPQSRMNFCSKVVHD